MNDIAKNSIPLAGFVAALMALPAAADVSCRYSANRMAELDLSGASKVVVVARSGELDVRGEPGRTRLQATGRACASSQELLDEIRLDSRREGDTIYVTVVMPEHTAGNIQLFGVRYKSMSMDLTVLTADSSVLSIDDSSGDMRVSNVRSARIVDTSGSIHVRDVAELVDVSDKSGDIVIERVGAAAVDDTSGNVRITQVRGDVLIREDSSGDLNIRKVGGSVHVVVDSSGGIYVDDVEGDVKIDEDSSGPIRVRGVGGNFTVLSDTSGGIRHSDVRGQVRLPGQD